MIQVRRSSERGHADHGWLNTFHTFSFADYYDPEFMGFRALRVINEDWVKPGMGFGLHGHRDMEIITYVLEGELAHRDSMGNGSSIQPGEVQRMSAGTGVRHSEFNHSKKDWVHLLQIWLLPEKDGITPSYEQKTFPETEKQGKFRLIASPDASDGSVKIHQDAKVYASVLCEGEKAQHAFNEGRHGWLQVARGRVTLGGSTLNAGDGAAISKESSIEVAAANGAKSEVILFDLA
ncbi:MAG: pirin family protein [Acidobacteriaceae bacterium]